MKINMDLRDNLKLPEEFTKEERRLRASHGGIASGEAKRQKKNMREAAKLLLDMEIPPSKGDMRAFLTQMGVADEDKTYAMGVMIAVLGKALKGDVNAAKFLRETSGLDMQLPSGGEPGEAAENIIIYLPDNGRDTELLGKGIDMSSQNIAEEETPQE